MPLDPIGTRASAPVLDAKVPAPASFEPEPDWSDRSSLAGDFMVMIDGQTEADYLRRAPEDRFCELIDGIVYMPAAVYPHHQWNIQLLVTLITMFDADHPVGVVLIGPAVLKLRDNCLLEPDLFVLPVGGAREIDGLYCRPPAHLVVEVLSSDRSHDLVRKRALYREAGIAELWFCDGRDRVVIVDRREGMTYVTTRISAGPLMSRSLPGFWFDVEWLWAETRPNMRTCLDRILAGPPVG